jgi:hypothetical protein
MSLWKVIAGDLGRATFWFLLIAALLLFAGAEGLEYIYMRF